MQKLKQWLERPAFLPLLCYAAALRMARQGLDGSRLGCPAGRPRGAPDAQEVGYRSHERAGEPNAEGGDRP